ncbi:hypothetical protein ACQ858_13220 [Variovorax ureilyticus]|uniref:hypothetical protein n=1 Tax=Variovorax ureilyticus TaxID=1836198 RepID=UPI003D66AA32
MKKRLEPFQQYLEHDLETADAHSNSTLVETLMHIGLVVWRFNALERSLDHAICIGINDRTDAVGLIVIHGMQYAQKVELYRRMCEDLHGAVPGAVPSFTGLIDALKAAATHRNLVVHADWTNSDVEGYTFTKVQIKNGGMMQEYAQLTVESMEKVCNEMTATLEQLHAYLTERDELLSPRPPA